MGPLGFEPLPCQKRVSLFLEIFAFSISSSTFFPQFLLFPSSLFAVDWKRQWLLRVSPRLRWNCGSRLAELGRRFLPQFLQTPLPKKARLVPLWGSQPARGGDYEVELGSLAQRWASSSLSFVQIEGSPHVFPLLSLVSEPLQVSLFSVWSPVLKRISLPPLNLFPSLWG